MQTSKKKPWLPGLIIGAFLSGYLGYLINGAWKTGMEFGAFMEAFNDVLSYPLRDYYNGNTLKAVLIALGIYAVAMVMYYTSQYNYMPGKEYGTARLAHPKEINRAIADKEEDNNRILSQNVRLSLDTRKTGLNNNELIIGGSGDCGIIVTGRTNLVKSRVCKA